MEARTTEDNLDEVSWLSTEELEACIIAGAPPACEDCAPTIKDRAHELTSFAGIGRLSLGKAVELLSAYSQATCTHIGAIAITEVPASVFANA